METHQSNYPRTIKCFVGHDGPCDGYINKNSYTYGDIAMVGKRGVGGAGSAGPIKPYAPVVGPSGTISTDSPIVTSKTIPTPISRELAYTNIVEWLYANDGKYSDKTKWREELIKVLRFNLLGK